MNSSADEPTEPVTCCLYRRKIVVGLVKVLSEEECGVPDSELADLLMFDVESPGGKQVITFRFCPWCGTPRVGNSETRITEPPRRVKFAAILTPDNAEAFERALAERPKCEIITCPGQAYPGIPLCLGHAREHEQAYLIPEDIHVHCADCQEPTAKPMPLAGTLGLCVECHRKRFDAGDIL